MTSRANCCVYGCNAVYKNNHDLTFHHFPNEGRVEHIGESGTPTMFDRKKMWEIKLKMGKRVSKNMRVCSRHFVEEDFSTPSGWGYKKRYLKKTAVPSLNLPLSIFNKEPIIYKLVKKKKRFERLLKRRQADKIPSTKQNRATFSHIKGAEALLDLSNNRQQGLAIDTVSDQGKDEEIMESNQILILKFVDASTQTDDLEEFQLF